MPNYFIRLLAGKKVIGPFEAFEVVKRIEQLRDQRAEFLVVDEDGKTVDVPAIARGDILSPRDEELATMMETEFAELWKAALDSSHGHRNLALSMMVRLVRRHIEVAALERERRLASAGKDE